ncbi:WHG domain-containing protein [Patulibacter sp. NPDC049589]|uniref:TetR/AcrR family transcriptional regulator n=1 Tax=Patulibacter sp. NPDC049589 TaxID=3154731 RepID=UPI00341491BD
MPSRTRDLRAELVDAAEAEVAVAGIGGVSLRAIARRADVSHQAPGHVFRDRAGLFTALAERGYDELAAAAEDARSAALGGGGGSAAEDAPAGAGAPVAGAGRPATAGDVPDASGAAARAAAALAAVGVAYVAFAQERHAVFSVIVRPELWNAGDPALAAARARAWGVLERAVGDAQAAGWASGVEHRTLVLLCLSMVHGLASLARDGVLAVEEPGVSADDLARRLTAALAALGGA